MKPLFILLILFAACSQTPEREDSFWVPEIYKQEVLYLKITSIHPKYIYDTMPEFDWDIAIRGTLLDGFVSSGYQVIKDDTIRFYATESDTTVEYIPYDTVFVRVLEKESEFRNNVLNLTKKFR